MEGLIGSVAFIVWLVLFVATIYLAAKTRHSMLFWGALALFLPPLSIVWVILLYCARDEYPVVV